MTGAGVTRVLAALALAPGPRAASAQAFDLRSPLASAPAGHTVMRAGRFTVAAQAGAAFHGAGAPSLLVGAEALAHPADDIGIGIWGAGGAPVGERTSGALRGVLAPEVVLVPFRGRGSLLDQLWFAYDMHFEVGPAWIQAVGRSPSAAPDPMVGARLVTFWRAWGHAHWSLGVEYRAVLNVSSSRSSWWKRSRAKRPPCTSSRRWSMSSPYAAIGCRAIARSRRRDGTREAKVVACSSPCSIRARVVAHDSRPTVCESGRREAQSADPASSETVSAPASVDVPAPSG